MQVRSSIAGLLFSDGHMSRAMCCRVRRDDKPLEQLPTGYKLQHPLLGCVTDVEDVRIVDKSRALSMNWNSADDTIELTDGTHGQTIRYQLFSLVIAASFLHTCNTRYTQLRSTAIFILLHVFINLLSLTQFSLWYPTARRTRTCIGLIVLTCVFPMR
jgi:hypothetical protein